MSEQETGGSVAVFVRLSPEADRALNERAARMGNVTRSAVVERAIERFIKETLPRDPGYMKRPTGRETKLRKFKVSAKAYALLQEARRRHGYSHQEMLRHALGDLVGAY